MGRALPFAWYRLRSTFRSELSYFLSVMILVGAMGGFALGSIEAARSTESSYTDFVTASHVPQLFVLDGVINPGIGLDSAYNPSLLRTLSHLPHVERVESTVELNLGPLTARGLPYANSAIAPPAEATVGGLDFNEDPVAITEGRMVDPRKPDEIVVDAASAKALGYHVGEEIRVGWVTNAQSSSGNFNPNQPIPVHQRARVKIVGITNGRATTLFQDQNNANGQSIMLFTPALTNKLLACCSNDMVSALTLQGGERHLSTVEAAVKRALPKGLPFVYQESQDIIATANATLRPETIALNVFGGIMGVAALLIAGQVISRRVRLRAPDLDIARALGADPPMCLWDGLLGSLGALLLGSLLAGVVAVALSPLGPLGPVQPFLRVSLHPDWTVIGVGVAILAVVLGGVAVLGSFRSLPDRARNRGDRFTSSRVTSAATRAGLPPAAVTGVRFALEPGVGRTAVPVRSAILGAILAVTVVVATVTFGSSLNTLVSHPALYGWNWNYDIDGGGGLGDIPGKAAAKLLDADPLVQSWTGIYYSALALDGENVPVMGATPGATVAPPILSGHGLQAPNQVVLGASTLRSLHKQLGDTVQVRIPGSKPVMLTVVGTATLPPIGVVGSSHLEMGTGAVLSYRIIPPAARNLFEVTPGPNAILVRTKGGNSPAALALAPGHRAPCGHRHQRRFRVRGGPPGRGPELRVPRDDTRTARCHPCGRRRRRARHHARDVGAAPTTRPGHPQDARVHQGAARHRRRRPGERRCRHRVCDRDPRRHRPGSGAVEPLRRRHQRCARRRRSRAGRSS